MQLSRCEEIVKDKSPTLLGDVLIRLVVESTFLDRCNNVLFIRAVPEEEEENGTNEEET